MRRRYQRELYVERIAQIKNLMPHCCVGVDVITGFPGETEEDFLVTYQFLNELNISYLHVFTYSERDNTAAIHLEGVVPLAERQRRTTMLRILSEKKRRAFYEENLGKMATVLFEEEIGDNGMMHGFTENYVKVRAKYDPMLVNELTKVVLSAIIDGEPMLVDVTAVEEVLQH